MVSEPVMDVLRGIHRAYRLARLAAVVGGPFGSSIGYSMQRLRGPAYTAYPHMLGHPRSVESFNNPDGDGLWLEVIGEAQDLFAERQQWEDWYLHRFLSMSCRVWWTSFCILIIGAFSFLGAENETVGIPLAWAFGAMVTLSVIGALFSDRFTDAVYRRNARFLDRISSELPDRLWLRIDGMRSENTGGPTKDDVLE